MLPKNDFDFTPSKKDLDDLILWLNDFKFSKPITNIRRDFSDGVLFAEIIKQSDYKLVQIINYVPSLNSKQKRINWETLNKKVLCKLNCVLSEDEIDGLCQCKEYYAEKCLLKLMANIEIYKNECQDNKKIDDDTFFKVNNNNKIQFNKKNFYLNEICERKQKIADLQNDILVS